MASIVVLTLEEFKRRRDASDILAVAGEGGYNSSAPRQVNNERIQDVLDRANETIVSMVHARNPEISEIETVDMPKMLKGAADDLTWYWLRDTEGDRGTVDQNTRDRFSDAMELLKKVEAGKVTLPIDRNGDGVVDTPNVDVGYVAGSFPEERSSSMLGGYRD